MDDFGPSRRRGWIRAGRETLPTLPRALDVVWGHSNMEYGMTVGCPPGPTGAMEYLIRQRCQLELYSVLVAILKNKRVKKKRVKEKES